MKIIMSLFDGDALTFDFMPGKFMKKAKIINIDYMNSGFFGVNHEFS
jgi:hypothetical protein